jgi:ligand-binding sensor domain-containing protein/class 3 adenylate cyclase
LSYRILNNKGLTQRIKLEPPVVKQLPLLYDTKGKIIKDSLGNPYIMGNGGISDFTNFTTDNGLALDAVSCALTDRTGTLWFGTQGGGVSRYDGRSFVTFSSIQGLIGNHIYCITEDRNGNIWFGTNGGGVSKYDGKSFMNYSLAQGLSGKTIRCICEDKEGNLWFGTEGHGVCRFTGKNTLDNNTDRNDTGKCFITYTREQGLPSNKIRSISLDKTGNLWMGTDSGACKYDGTHFFTFTTLQGLPSNNISKIYRDNSGNLWLGTDSSGISKYDGRHFVNFSPAQGLAGNNISCICEDKSGNIWLGVFGGGVSRFDGQSFVSFKTRQGLGSDYVRSMTTDKNGAVWIGTEGGGLSRYDGESFVTFSESLGLSNNNVRTICEDKNGNVWFGTIGGGAIRYDGKSFVSFTTAQGLPANSILSIYEDRSGDLWFGTETGGVTRYSGNCNDRSAISNMGNNPSSRSFVTYTSAQGLGSNTIRSIFQDKTGNMWLGTQGAGVCKFDGLSFTNYTAAQGLPGATIRCMYQDTTGSIWLGTQGGGLSRIDGKSILSFSVAQGLPVNIVWSICADRYNNLWMATSEGLCVLRADLVSKLNYNTNGSTSAIVPPGGFFKTFTTIDGLPDNFVTQVQLLPDGRIALGTNFGITLFRPSSDASTLNELEIFNSNTGYPAKDVNTGQNGMLADHNGYIWAATGSQKTAVVRFNPSALHSYKEAPTVLISGIRVNEENICWYDLLTPDTVRAKRNLVPAHINEEVITIGRVLSQRERDSMRRKYGAISFDNIRRFYPVPEHLELPYKFNRITVDFIALEPGKPNLVNYRYMLEGLDKEWSPVIKKTTATYGNLREGTYTFKVKAQGPKGVWCAPVSYTFRVLPPWYRTWWAYLLFVLLSMIILYLIYRWRVASLLKRQKELEETITERTAQVISEKEEVEKQKAVVELEKQRSDQLLLNILPSEVAEELKSKGSADAKLLNNVTVLFTDFKWFTQLSEKLSPQALVAEINHCFSAFDMIMAKYGVEKIKTIGDAYMAAGGLPTPNLTHASDTVKAALEIQAFMAQHKAEREAQGELFFEIRIGLHTGPVVAGIVGVKKFQYDIWGDTVNTASRMESSGEVGKVNISDSTYLLIKDEFKCQYRGKIEAKGKGEIDMYYVIGKE